MAMVKSQKYSGVYYNQLENKDKVFYFNDKDKNDNNKLKWVKVGKESDGYSQDITKTLRDEQLSQMNHGKDITKVANKKKKELITLDILANRYFDDRKSTNERKQKYTNHIKPLIGNRQIENITKVDIKKVVNSVLDLGRSNGTANSVLSLISTIFNHSIKQHGLKLINPCIGISKLKDDNKRDRFLTTDEIKKLKDEVKDNFFVNLFVEFALCTGGRLETILHIQKKVDLFHLQCLFGIQLRSSFDKVDHQ
mgnify:FL=1